MERVTGLGGIFFKARDPGALQDWYVRVLGLPLVQGFVVFTDLEPGHGYQVWHAFPEATDYFEPDPSTFMVNFRVRDLDAMLAQVRASGAEVVGGPDDTEQGRFAWVLDPEGHKIELWQPA